MEDKNETIEIIDTPFFFSLKIVLKKKVVKSIDFIEKQTSNFSSAENLSPYSKQLIRYFNGKKADFTLPVLLNGFSDFTLKVFEEVKKISYGNTVTYKDIAVLLGDKNLARAVGKALRINPVPIFIPCHRVIGSDGSLKGFMGKEGVEIKKILLDLEKKYLVLYKNL